MTFSERVEYQKAVLMYKNMHNLAPTYLSELFTAQMRFIIMF